MWNHLMFLISLRHLGASLRSSLMSRTINSRRVCPLITSSRYWVESISQLKTYIECQNLQGFPQRMGICLLSTFLEAKWPQKWEKKDPYWGHLSPSKWVQTHKSPFLGTPWYNEYIHFMLIPVSSKTSLTAQSSIFSPSLIFPFGKPQHPLTPTLHRIKSWNENLLSHFGRVELWWRMDSK